MHQIRQMWFRRRELEQLHSLERVGVRRSASARFISRRADHAVAPRNEGLGEITAILSADSGDESGRHRQAYMKKGAPMVLLLAVITRCVVTPLEGRVARAGSCRRRDTACRHESA